MSDPTVADVSFYWWIRLVYRLSSTLFCTLFLSTLMEDDEKLVVSYPEPELYHEKQPRKRMDMLNVVLVPSCALTLAGEAFALPKAVSIRRHSPPG